MISNTTIRDRNSVEMYLISHACHTLIQSHSAWLHCPTIFRKMYEIWNLLSRNFLLVPLTSEQSLQHWLRTHSLSADYSSHSLTHTCARARVQTAHTESTAVDEYQRKCPFLGALAKLWKVTISFVMSVRPSAWNNSAPTKWISMKFDSWAFFEDMSRKFKFH